MSTQPRISIIVPCYNYGRFIGETLESLRGQSCADWECIIVDDGSKDDSAEICKAWTQKDDRIHYIYQENQGLPAARNTGIQAAKGQYIQFLDSDDLLQKDKLKLQADLLDNQPEIDLVYSGLRYFYDGKPNELIYSNTWSNRPWTLARSGNGNDLLEDLVISCVIMPPMPMLRRSAIDRVGLFSRDLRSCEDWEFWQRCAQSPLRFHYLDAPDTLSLMRLHGTSMTRNRPVMIRAMIEVRHRLRRTLTDTRLKRLNERCLNRDYMEFALVERSENGFRAGFRLLRQLAAEKKRLPLYLFMPAYIVLPPATSLSFIYLMRSAVKRWRKLLGWI